MSSNLHRSLRFREALALQLNIWGLKEAKPKRMHRKLSDAVANDDPLSQITGLGPWAVVVSTDGQRDFTAALDSARSIAQHDGLPYSATVWEKHSHSLGVSDSLVVMSLIEWAELVQRDIARKASEHA